MKYWSKKAIKWLETPLPVGITIIPASRDALFPAAYNYANDAGYNVTGTGVYGQGVRYQAGAMGCCGLTLVHSLSTNHNDVVAAHLWAALDKTTGSAYNLFYVTGTARQQWHESFLPEVGMQVIKEFGNPQHYNWPLKLWARTFPVAKKYTNDAGKVIEFREMSSL